MLFHDRDAVSKVVMICRKARGESTVDAFLIRKRCRGCHGRKTSIDTVMTRKMYRGCHERKTTPDTARTKKKEQRLS